MIRRIKRHESLVKKLVLISLIVPLSGCLDMFALYPTGPKRTYEEEEKNDYTVGVGNHSGKDIYIESIAIDGEMLDKQIGYLYCNERLDVNGYSYLVKLDLDTPLPKDNISVVWEPLTGGGVKEVVLDIPKTDFITRYVEKYKGSAYLYADIREDNNVWLRVSHTKSRLENAEDVFVLSKAKATPFMKSEIDGSEADSAKEKAINRVKKHRASNARYKAKYIETIEKLKKEIEELKDVKAELSDAEKTGLNKKINKVRITKSLLNELEDFECWSEEEKINYMSDKLNIPKNQFLFDRWYPGAPQNEQGTD